MAISMFNKSVFSKKSMGIALLATGISACGSDNNATEVVLEYEVIVYNDTAEQPFSPILVALHNSDISLWSVGSDASSALENMAEGGSNTELLALFKGYDVAVSGSSAIAPGRNELLTISANQSHATQLSFSSMLVNTNDAFSGLNAVDISNLEVGVSMTYNLPVYDAGTEANSEAAGSIPGPADGGEGYNVVRDDVMNKVTRHPGLVTQADDAASVLLPEHRISGNVGRLVITRIN